MGLLDALQSDDGLLGLALLSAGAAKPVRTSLGEGLLGGMQLVQQQRNAREERAQRMRMQQMQEQQMQMQLAAQKRQQTMEDEARAREAQFRSLIPSPQMEANTEALSGGGGQTVANAAKVRPVDPAQQLQYEALRLGQIKPLDYINSQRKDTTPMKIGAGETLLDPRTLKPLFTNPKESATPEAIRAIEAVYGPNSPQAMRAKESYIAKLTTHQPATQVNVNTEKPLLNTVAQGLGKQIDDSLGAARAATSAISTAQTLRAAVDSGKIVAGPGATFRVLGLQVGQMLGVGGKNGAEILANTRTAIKSMAQAELDAAQQMKGQGQITESERDIIRRAAAGNIDDLTAPEIRLLSDAMEKTGRFKIAQHKNNVKGLANMPGAAPLLPFYQVDEPPAYQAPGGVDLGGGFKLKKGR